jgi:hypothetical protein
MATYSTPGMVSLRLRLPAGRISVTTVEGDETRVSVEAVGDDEALRLVREEACLVGPDEHEVVVEVPDHARFPGVGGPPELSVSVEAPHGTRVDARTASADVTGEGRFGALKVKTASGDVRFDDIGGDALVESASGDVELESVGGRCEVSTASGDVTLGRVAGAARVKLASGDLSVGEALGSVTGDVASGDLDLGSVASGKVNLRTMSGDVEVGVRRGSRVWLDLNSMTGAVTSDLDVTGDGAGRGDAQVEIRASSVSGDIRVTRVGSTETHAASS